MVPIPERVTSKQLNSDKNKRMNKIFYIIQFFKKLLLKQNKRMKLAWNLLKLNLTISMFNKPLKMLFLNIIIITIIRLIFMKEIYSVKKVYETIYDEMNDPNQGFNDDNHYRKLSGGGWAIDHPDGSTTIIVKGVNGEWYNSNDVEEEVENGETRPYS